MTIFSNMFRFFFIKYIVVLQPQYCLNNIGLGSFAFARHYLRNHYYFLLLRVMRCFSSPRSPPIKGYHAFNMVGCPIRKSSDQRSFAPTRSLSQLITSFFASESQGIRHSLLLTSLFFLALSYSCIFNPKYNNISLYYCILIYFTFSLVQYVKDLIHVTVQCWFMPIKALNQMVIISLNCQQPLLLPHPSSLVENNGFEPLTLCVQGRCSSQLS